MSQKSQNDRITELEEKVNAIYNNLLIKIIIVNPAKSFIIFILLLLIISGILSIDSILEFLIKWLK